MVLQSSVFLIYFLLQLQGCWENVIVTDKLIPRINSKGLLGLRAFCKNVYEQQWVKHWWVGDISVVEMDNLSYDWIGLPGKVALTNVLVPLRDWRWVSGQLSALDLVCNPCTFCFWTRGHVGLTHEVIYDNILGKLHHFGRAPSVLQFSTFCSGLHQFRDTVIAPL